MSSTRFATTGGAAASDGGAAAGGEPADQPSLSAAAIAAALGQPPPTAQQAAIIEHPPSPVLVVAGAGSGKTETMAARVVWLVANRIVEPDAVLGLTFTRKAAAELAHRVGTRLRTLREAGLWAPADGEAGLLAPPSISTYHAYAGRLVREHALRIGREPEARLLTEASAWQIAHEVVAAYDGPLEEIGRAESTITAAVVHLAGELAEHLVTPEQLAEWLDRIEARFVAIETAGRALTGDSAAMRADLAARRALIPVLAAYAAAKRARGALDFADQMALAAQIATGHPAVGAIERARYRAVLLDEFQDTSHAQLELLRALFAPPGTAMAVTAVGDPHQSIYAWRGASAATLAAFPQAFGAGQAPVLPLSVTWRNDHRVLAAANAVAAPLRAGAHVPVEPLVAAPKAGPGRVEALRAHTVEEEADAVAAWIVAQRAAGATSSAVLCRKRSQFAPILAALEAAGAPYEVVGIGGLLLTPEVQDVVALLSIAHDAARGDRLMRLLTGPLVRIGAADLDAFHAWARRAQQPADHRGPQSHGTDLSDAAADRVSLVEALRVLADSSPAERAETGIGPVALGRLIDLARRIAQVRAATGTGIAELVGEAERALGLDIEVLARPAFSTAAARAHLDAFTDVAAQFAAGSDRPTIGGFLAWLDAALEEERGLDLGTMDSAPGAVQVLTVHAAKGLEWDAVAVPGLVESGFPVHSASTTTYDEQGGNWRIGSPADSAWTRGVDSLPYDLRGDSAALPALDWRSAGDAPEFDQRRVQFRADAGAAAIAEERRLAYVAFTRARHHLLLTAHVWGTQTSPRLPSRFLTELRADHPDLIEVGHWADDPEPGTENPRLAAPVSATWPRHEPPPQHILAAAGAVLASPPADRLPPELSVLLAERAAPRAGAFDPADPQAAPRALAALGGHVTTSQLVSYVADPTAFPAAVRRPMPQPPSPGTRRGTAFHSWVERHYRRSALLEPDELPGSADLDEPPGADLDVLIERFRESPWAAREPLEVEVAVEMVLAGVAIRGRIDAVFPDGDDGVIIVDWKTGAPPAGGVGAARATQLAVYRIAYARLRGLDPARVRAAFYYAGTGATIYPEVASQAELDALAAELSGSPG